MRTKRYILSLRTYDLVTVCKRLAVGNVIGSVWSAWLREKYERAHLKFGIRTRFDYHGAFAAVVL